MATKKISDLQLRSNFDDTCNLAADDASQTWRVTGAQLRAAVISQAAIAALTAKTAPAADDELILGDVSGASTKKVKKSDLVKGTIAAKSSAYTVLSTDDVLTLSGASFTVTLPAAASVPGKRFTFIHNDSTLGRVYTIDANGSETINGALTKKVALMGETLIILSDGTGWLITSRRIPQEWVPFSPTGVWTANATYTGRYRRVGDSVELDYTVSATGSPTPAGGTELGLNLPTGISADLTKNASNTVEGNKTCGTASLICLGAYYAATPFLFSSTQIKLSSISKLSATNHNQFTVHATFPDNFQNGDRVYLRAMIPITDWEG